MAKPPSPKKRAAVRSAKRARTNQGWYALTALVVIAGVALIMFQRMTADAAVGPFISGSNNGIDEHWHAALGVYDCDHWLGDGSSGDGLWTWPAASPQGSPSRVDNTAIYAGMHSHADGVIHMEPASSEDAGKHATVGKYFEYGGWDVDETSYDFLGTKRKNGDKCGDKPGKLSWGKAKFEGDPAKRLVFAPGEGDVAGLKLADNEVVVIAFLPEGKTINDIGNPPGAEKLPGAAEREGQTPETTPTPTPTTPGGSTPDIDTSPSSVPTSVPSASTPSSAATP